MIQKIIYHSYRVIQKSILHQEILNTLSLINKTTSVTLGPRGRLVAIQTQLNQPRITKDGVTVVKHLQFDQRLNNSILNLVKNTANNANKYSGDGTTTTTLLSCQIVKIANRLGLANMNQSDVRKGFEIAKNIGLQFLQQISRKVKERKQLFNVAMISTNGNQKLSNLISEALYNSKQIKVQKSKNTNSYLQYVNGTKIIRGIPNQLLINKINKIQFDYPVILVSLKKINQVKQIIPVLQKVKKMKKQLVIFAPDISQAVTSIIYYNYSKKIIQACPIRMPGLQSYSSQLLKNIANITQSFLFTQFTQNIQNIDFHHFGKAIKISIDEYETTIVTKNNSDEKNCIFHVGANSQTEMLQQYDKVIDALNSAKSAKTNGVVPGGGISYLRISQVLQDYRQQNEGIRLGVRCISLALKQPIKKLLELSELSYLKKTMGSEGYDFKQNEYVDMFEKGIVQSLSVSKNCLIDSISLASMLISLQVGVVLDLKYKESDYKNYMGKYSL